MRTFSDVYGSLAIANKTADAACEGRLSSTIASDDGSDTSSPEGDARNVDAAARLRVVIVHVPYFYKLVLLASCAALFSCNGRKGWCTQTKRSRLGSSGCIELLGVNLAFHAA